ncbi:MAG: hypothetical protein R2832_18180 [Rhodothermales bacterium]
MTKRVFKDQAVKSTRSVIARPAILLTIILAPMLACAQPQNNAPSAGPDLDVTSASVRLYTDLNILVFEQHVAGTAGATIPKAVGTVDKAPVLGYVFPTTLKPEDVGFGVGDGIVALAATSHPDFDDTPLWDENGDRNFKNDGRVFHSHWVVLVPDTRVAGGLAVKETKQIEQDLPPTAPGMPMFLDSPGFSVKLIGNTLRLVVPLDRTGGKSDFAFDAVTAYMEVNQSDEGRPMLGVYKVYDVLSGDLSLPYKVAAN